MGSSTSPAPVPVTILSGFLGAGKTTLLRALLTSGHVAPETVGLIINDVAEVNVDARLVQERVPHEGATQAAATEEVHGACVCCSGSEELLSLVRRLASRTPPLKHIVVECSGMSDPAGIVSAFKASFPHSASLPRETASREAAAHTDHGTQPFLSAVVTVLDASTVASWIGAPPGASPSAFAPLPSDSDSQRPISSHCPENAPGCLAGGSDRSDEAAHTNESLRGTLSQLFVSQVESASTIVIHKVDRVLVAVLQRCIQFVRALNPGAAVHCVKFGAMDPALILNPTTPYFLRPEAQGRTRATPPQLAVQHSTPASCGHTSEGRPCSQHECQGEEPSLQGDSVGEGMGEGSGVGRTEAGAACQVGSGREDPQAVHRGMPGGVRSFVFRAVRPFHPDRLQALIRRMRREMAVLEQGDSWSSLAGAPGTTQGQGLQLQGNPLGQAVTAVTASQSSSLGLHNGGRNAREVPMLMRGVLRSKGAVWVAPDVALSREWSQSRGVLELQKGHPWEANGHAGSVPGALGQDSIGTEGVPGAEGGVLSGTPPGARQEVVFIGTAEMEEGVLRGALEGCLLTDEEMQGGPEAWRRTMKDRIALTLSVAARTKAARMPSAHGSLCPCCDPQLKALLGSHLTL